MLYWSLRTVSPIERGVLLIWVVPSNRRWNIRWCQSTPPQQIQSATNYATRIWSTTIVVVDYSSSSSSGFDGSRTACCRYFGGRTFQWEQYYFSNSSFFMTFYSRTWFPQAYNTIPGHVPLPFVSLINQLQLASTREILILIGLYNGVMGDGLLLLCEMIRSRWPYSFMIDDGFGSRAADFVDLYFEVSIIFDIVWCHTRRIKIW